MSGASGDDETREGVLRPGKYYFDRAWNDPPEFEHDAQAKAAAATASCGSAGLKFNKRVGHSLASGPMPSSTGKAATAAGGSSGDDGLFQPKLQDAGARSLADMLPPPPPPLSSSNLQISGDSLSKVKISSERDAHGVDGGSEVDIDSCVRDLETLADNSSDLTDFKRKDIKRRIGTMATKWKSGSLSKKVESGMGRVTQLLIDGDAAGADKLLQSMIVDFPSHCNPWAVGIKHLIASVKPRGDISDEAAVKGIANPL